MVRKSKFWKITTAELEVSLIKWKHCKILPCCLSISCHRCPYRGLQCAEPEIEKKIIAGFKKELRRRKKNEC